MTLAFPLKCFRSKIISAATVRIIGLTKIEFLPPDWIYLSIETMTVVFPEIRLRCKKFYLFWVHCGLQDSHKVYSIREATVEQNQTVCFIGIHGFQMPLVCPNGVGGGVYGVFDSRGRLQCWAIEILELRIHHMPPYAPLPGGLDITLIGA